MKRTIIIIVSIGLFAALVLLMPAIQSSTNCGGNSAALCDCSGYAKMVFVAALESSARKAATAHSTTSDIALFNIDSFPTDYIQMIPVGNHWIPRARYFLKAGDIEINNTAPRSIIFVCDTPFGNVPRKWFGKTNPAHAVGYSSGEAGLISPQEYAALNLSSFVEAGEFVRQKKAQPISPGDVANRAAPEK